MPTASMKMMHTELGTIITYNDMNFKKLEQNIRNVCTTFELGTFKGFENVESGIFLKLAIFNTSKKDGYKFWYDENNYIPQ